MLLSKHAHTGYYSDQPPGPDFDPYERSATIFKSYTYDPRGRLLRVEQKTEDPDNPGHETEYTTLSEHRYDLLGQMTGKNLGYDAGTQFLQIGDYQYNIQGWLSKFNQPSTTTPSGTYRDLLAFELHYNTGASAIVSGTPNLFNGNISAMQWQVLGESEEIRAFAFSYDQMNRLTLARYREKTSSSWNVNTSRYDVTNLIYDRNGNIKSLQRKGMTNPIADPPGYGVMDNLSYTYENSGKSNRLQRINDAGVKTVMTGVEHFVDGNTSNTDYLYDNSGNLKQDLNKGISSIVYNHLNKPTLITFSNGKKIQYIYDAAGAKLRQKVFGNGGSVTTVETDYVGPFHYEDADGDGSGATPEILFFSHEEGRVRRAGSDLIYETFLKDHLGNVRVMFADMDGNGWVDPDPVNGEVLQIDHYYPFGLRMAGLSLVPAVKNSYLYNGIELQDEWGLNIYDTFYRNLDPSTARWWQVDPKTNERESPYVSMANNPLNLIDPQGDTTFYFTPKGEFLGQVNDDLENQIHFIAQDKFVGLGESYGAKITFYSERGSITFEEGADINSFSAKGRNSSEAYIGVNTYEGLINVNEKAKKSEHGGFIELGSKGGELEVTEYEEGISDENGYDHSKIKNKTGCEYCDFHTHPPGYIQVPSPFDYNQNDRNQAGVIVGSRGELYIYSKNRIKDVPMSKRQYPKATAEYIQGQFKYIAPTFLIKR